MDRRQDEESLAPYQPKERARGRAWGADGKRVLFSGRPGTTQLLPAAADGSGAVETLLTGEAPPYPASADANLIVSLQREATEDGRYQIWSRPVSAPGGPQRFAESKFNMRDASFSPVGHWMWYVSDDAGQDEVWVQAFPAGEKHKVSTDGGTNPAWARSGKELFYLGQARSSEPAHDSGGFHTRPGVQSRRAPPALRGRYYVTIPQRNYEVTPDGQHFVALQARERPARTVDKLSVVFNWAQELNQRAPRGAH